MRFLIMAACSLILTCAPAAAADPKGVWLVDDRSAQIQIENCGGAYWGIVLWERSPGRDTENPDPSLRGRPTLGIPILLGMRPSVPQRPDGPRSKGLDQTNAQPACSTRERLRHSIP